ncbi:MAG: HAMP domain-containing protein [Phycisphaerae bacterium]|nr:HAMP domain-containing protein [Phycisphaerae bacterium]
MSLSISQRLTLTVALMTGLILVPACTLLCLTLKRTMEASVLDLAYSQALEVERSVWTQLDEDILFDFEGQRVTFDTLNIAKSDWGLIRGNGLVDTAAGVLKDESVLPAECTRVLRLLSNRSFAVAAVPLTPDHPFTWVDLPEPVRHTIEDRMAGGTFLWAKADVLKEDNIYVVQMLDATQIMMFSVTEQGECVEVGADPLIQSLPSGMAEILSQGQGLLAHRITGWHVYEGELIAEVQGVDPNGVQIHVGVNRFGQEYELDENGVPAALLEPSRLYVMAAMDITREKARATMLGGGIMLGGVGIWGLFIAVAWLVTKRALGPVHDMILQADRIMPSKLNERLPVRSATDELGRVTKTVNRMLDRLQQGYLRERQFTGDVSHELRNPLAKVMAEIELAQSKERDAKEHQEILARLKGYTQALQHLVDSLLMLARLDTGFQNLEIQPFDVAELVVETLRTFSKAFASRIHIELGPSISPLMAIGHASLISVLLGNLLDNALRYSPETSPVHLRIHRQGKTIQFRVEDEGFGIPEDQRILVFDRFYRLEKSRSKKTGGAGLGLAIVQAIAEMHHMTVDITQAHTRGTVVSFALPAQQD